MADTLISDTHRFVKRLSAAGMPVELAEVLQVELPENSAEVATTSDIIAQREDFDALRKEFDTLRKEFEAPRKAFDVFRGELKALESRVNAKTDLLGESLRTSMAAMEKSLRADMKLWALGGNGAVALLIVARRVFG